MIMRRIVKIMKREIVHDNEKNSEDNEAGNGA